MSEEAGIRAHYLSVPYNNSMGFIRRIWAFVRFAWCAARKAASLPADVVFATSTPLTIVIPAVYAAKKNRVPMVFEVRDLWPELPIAVGVLKNYWLIVAARILERWAYRHSSWIVALSPGMKEGIVAAGYPAERIAVIPNSCDLDLFDVPPSLGDDLRRRTPWLRDRPLVLYAGTLGRINGVEYFTKMAASLADRDPQVCFLTLGDGAEYDKVQRVASDLGVLGKNFFMLRAVPKQEMPAFFSAADIAISLIVDLPALWNNSANKFFDALAAGKPVAVNYGGWQAELLRESGAGIELPARDPLQAATQLSEWIHDQQRMRRAHAAARSLAQTRFARDQLARQLVNILLMVAKENSDIEPQ